MAYWVKIWGLLSTLLILSALMVLNSCKTPSILVTEEQRMGDEYSNQNDYETAIIHYRNSLTQSRKLGVYRNLEVEADICRKIAYAFSVQGKYPEALEYAHFAYSRDSMLQNQLGIIEDFRELGKVHLYMGDFNQGTVYLDSVVQLSDGLESSLKSTKLTSLADTYLTLSQVNNVLGKFSSAELECRSALDIYTQLNDDMGRMECMLLLGKIKNETGIRAQAELYVKRSEKLCRELELNRTRHIHLLADIAEDKSEYQEAIQLRLQAIEEAKGSRILPGIIWTTLAAGDTYGTLGDTEKAETYYNEAILLQDSSNIASSSLDASAALRTGRANTAARYFSEIGSQVAAGLAYLKLGDLMLERKNYPFALRQYDKALNEFNNSGSPEGKSRAMLMLAETQFSMGHINEAAEQLEKARSNTRHPETLWQVEYLSGRIKEAAGHNKEAIEAYKRSVAIIEEIRGKITIDELKSAYVNDKIKVYDRLINLLMQENDIRSAFDYSERARARAFLDLIGNTKVNVHNNEDQRLVLEEQDLRMQIVALSKMLHQEDLGSGKRFTRAAIEKDLLVCRTQYTDLIHKLKIAAPEYASLVSISPPEPSLLQSLADKQHAFLVYWIGEEKSFAWIVKKEQIIAREIPYSEEDMMNITIDSRNAIRRISDFTEGDIRTNSNLSVQTLRDGYKMLIKPVSEDLAGIETIGIVPHKVLHLLPFQALMSQDNKFLTEDHNLYYAPSLSTLYSMKDRHESDGGSMLAMALGDLALGGFDGLPGTKKEVENIHAILPGLTARYEKESSETFFKENAASFDHIHLATHGFMDQAQPMYSFVLFNSSDSDDGFLTVNEIFDLNLKSKLVVLSACQTGLGELSEGDELVGLSRAMLYAGSENVIVSLWSVADEQTAYLMTRFYEYLLEHNMVVALHKAQIATLEKFKCPLYWAPFQLIGRGL